jgi:hypothetical protein
MGWCIITGQWGGQTVNRNNNGAVYYNGITGGGEDGAVYYCTAPLSDGSSHSILLD